MRKPAWDLLGKHWYAAPRVLHDCSMNSTTNICMDYCCSRSSRLADHPNFELPFRGPDELLDSRALSPRGAH